MHRRFTAAVAALAVAAVTLTSVAAAGPAVAKQRVQITMNGLPNGKFVLTPVQAGALEPDSGTVSPAVANYVPRTVVRDGQAVEIYKPVVWTLTGKRGTLSVREPRNEWVQTGGPAIGTGTWNVVRGTGQYAKVAGGGRSAHAGLNRGTGAWFVGQEGFISQN
jgi:hypothetical protein